MALYCIDVMVGSPEDECASVSVFVEADDLITAVQMAAKQHVVETTDILSAELIADSVLRKRGH